MHHKVNLVDSFNVKLYLCLVLTCALFPGAQKENQKEHLADNSRINFSAVWDM